MRYKHELDGHSRLSDALHLRSADQLRPLLKVLPGVPRRTYMRKDAIVQVIENGLTGHALKELLDLMTDDQRAVLGAVVHSPGRKMDFRRLEARFGSRAREALWDKEKRGIFGRLEVLTAPREYDEPSHIVPQDLARRLKPYFRAPGLSVMRSFKEAPPESGWESDGPSDGDAEPAAGPFSQRNREVGAQQEIFAVLQAVDGGVVTVDTKTGQPEAAGVRRVSGVLADDDFYSRKAGAFSHSNIGPIRAYGWPWLLRAGGLAKKKRGGTLGLTEFGRIAAGAPAPNTLKSLWNSWLRSDVFDEIRRCNVDHIRTKRAKRELTMPCYRRSAIAETLKHCPVGEWVAVKEFERFMLANGLEFEVTVELATLGISSLRQDSPAFLESRGWHLLQRPYIRCFLFEYAATLGLIDVCYQVPDHARRNAAGAQLVSRTTQKSRYDGLACFKLNPLGAYCLDLTKEYAPAAAPSNLRISVRSNLSIEVDGVPRTDQALLLDRYATRESETLWRLDRVKIVSVIERGTGLDELRGFLKSHDDQSLPELVEGFLTQVERDGRALKFRGRVVMFECADTAVAERIASDRVCGKLCRRVGDTELAVAEKSEGRFREAARNIGYGIGGE